MWGNGWKEDRSGNGKSGYTAIAKVFHASEDTFQTGRRTVKIEMDRSEMNLKIKLKSW